MTFTLYRIACSVNGKSYVGRTIQPKLRRSQHFSDLGKGIHKNAHLQAAFNLYGRDSFSWIEMLKYDSLSELKDGEQFFLDQLWNSDALFNLSKNSWGGGVAGKVVSEETRKQMSERMRAVHASRTPEFRAEVAASLRGQKRSPEQRAKMSAWQKGKKRKPHSAETRAKIGAANKIHYLDPQVLAEIAARRVGIKASAETCEKLSGSLKAYWIRRKAGQHAVS